MTFTTDAVPVLWRHARLDFDTVRRQHVLLYPEGSVLLNESGGAILDLCDGRRTVGDIARILGERADRDVTEDVTEFLTELAAGELVREA